MDHAPTPGRVVLEHIETIPGIAEPELPVSVFDNGANTIGNVTELEFIRRNPGKRLPIVAACAKRSYTSSTAEPDMSLAVLVSTVDVIRTERHAWVFRTWVLRIMLIAELGS